MIHVSAITNEGHLHSRQQALQFPLHWQLAVMGHWHRQGANLEGQAERSSGGKGGVHSPPIEADFICFHLLLVLEY